MAKKLPAFQFYPGDWMKDPELRSVSISARGLWMDLLCLMHESDRRGFLQHATGKPWTLEQIARVTGCATDEVSRLLQELEDSGVFSRTEQGIPYSRRIVKDERKRQACREAGKKGGNPALKTKRLQPTLKGSLNGHVKGGVNQKSTPSSSDYSSENTSVGSAEQDTSPPPNTSPDTAKLDEIEQLIREKCLGMEPIDLNLEGRLLTVVGMINALVKDASEIRLFLSSRRKPPKLGFFVEDFRAWRLEQQQSENVGAGSDFMTKMFSLGGKMKTRMA